MKLERYRELTQFAKELHKGRLDKAGEPCWRHNTRIIEICTTVLAAYGHDITAIYKKGSYDNLIITALFHDVLEDIPNGEKILFAYLLDAEIKYNIERIKDLTKPGDMAYGDYIDKVISTEDWVVLLIKFADLIDHMERLHLVTDEAERERLAQKYHHPLTKIRIATKKLLDKGFDDGTCLAILPNQ